MPANKNTCECPNPPGGVAVCEAHQLAICHVRDGEARTYCIDPPGGNATTLEELPLDTLETWVTSHVLRVSGATLEDLLLRSEYADLMRSNAFAFRRHLELSDGHGGAVTFRLPEVLLARVRRDNEMGV